MKTTVIDGAISATLRSMLIRDYNTPLSFNFQWTSFDFRVWLSSSGAFEAQVRDSRQCWMIINYTVNYGISFTLMGVCVPFPAIYWAGFHVVLGSSSLF